MPMYHVNPKTGNPGVCKAQYSCPFAKAEEHFPTKAAARVAYELQQEEGVGSTSSSPKKVETLAKDIMKAYDAFRGAQSAARGFQAPQAAQERHEKARFALYKSYRAYFAALEKNPHDRRAAPVSSPAESVALMAQWKRHYQELEEYYARYFRRG